MKQRPGTVSLALGAIALFLAREPLNRAVGSLISGGDDDGSEDERGGVGKRNPSANGIEGASEWPSEQDNDNDN